VRSTQSNGRYVLAEVQAISRGGIMQLAAAGFAAEMTHTHVSDSDLTPSEASALAPSTYYLLLTTYYLLLTTYYLLLTTYYLLLTTYYLLLTTEASALAPAGIATTEACERWQLLHLLEFVHDAVAQRR
jgi:hypothetical protein